MILLDEQGLMISTVSEDDLHKMARLVGLKRHQCQGGPNPHYILKTWRMIRNAMNHGARKIERIDVDRISETFSKNCQI